MTTDPHATRRRVFIVEDEVLLALDLEMIAEEVGFSVAGQAARKSDAIQGIENSRPDLCLVDLHLLDGPTGVDVAKFAAENTDAMVVFVTANRAALPDDLCGAYGVIAKPYTVTGMRDALQHLLGVLNADVDAHVAAPVELKAASA